MHVKSASLLHLLLC